MTSKSTLYTRLLIPEWVKLGLMSSHISKFIPNYSEDFFKECFSIKQLFETLNSKKKPELGLGTAYHYKNFCFINNMKNDPVWMVIKDNKIYAHIIIVNFFSKFKNFLELFEKMEKISAQKLQLNHLKSLYEVLDF